MDTERRSQTGHVAYDVDVQTEHVAYDVDMHERRESVKFAEHVTVIGTER